jgi:hypothetical protein
MMTNVGYLTIISALLLNLSVTGTTQADAAEEDVAWVEEISVMPDGTHQVLRYRPGERPQQQRIAAPPAEPRRRDLNTVEKETLYQLEEDFAHGRITESEYNLRKRGLYRSTFMSGSPDGDSPLYQSGSF